MEKLAKQYGLTVEQVKEIANGYNRIQQREKYHTPEGRARQAEYNRRWKERHNK